MGPGRDVAARAGDRVPTELAAMGQAMRTERQWTATVMVTRGAAQRSWGRTAMAADAGDRVPTELAAMGQAMRT